MFEAPWLMLIAIVALTNFIVLTFASLTHIRNEQQPVRKHF